MKTKLMVLGLMFAASTTLAGPPECVAPGKANQLEIQELDADQVGETTAEVMFVCDTKRVASLKIKRINAGTVPAHKLVAAVAFTKNSLPFADVVTAQTIPGSDDALIFIPQNAIAALSRGEVITINYNTAGFQLGRTAISIK